MKKNFKVIDDIINEESAYCDGAMTSAAATNATKASTGVPIEEDEEELKPTKREWRSMTDEEHYKLQKQKKKQ